MGRRAQHPNVEAQRVAPVHIPPLRPFPSQISIPQAYQVAGSVLI